MFHFNRTIPAVAICASLFGSTAYADISTNDVWDIWKNYMSSFGYEVTANEAESGDTLTLTDIKATYSLPKEKGTAYSTISELILKENGDGTVSVICPEVMTIISHAEVKPEDKKNTEAQPVPTEGESQATSDGPNITNIGMEMQCADLEMIASGTPENMVFDYSGPSMTVKLLEFDTPSQDADIERLELTMNGVKGQSTYDNTGDNQSRGQKFSAETVQYSTEMAGTDGKGDVTATATINDISFEGTGNYPEEADMSSALGMALMGMEGTFQYGSSRTEFKSSEPMSGEFKSSSGGGNFLMKDGVVSFDFTSNEPSMTITEGIPFPIEITAKETSMKFMIPFAPGEESKDFGFGMSYKEIVIPDMLWGMFDPQQKLPRDPLTLAVELSGKGKLQADFSDLEEVAKVESGDKKMGELETLSLKSLTLRGVGVELTGAGDLSFDNTKTVENGLPEPSGAINLKLDGSNALIDNLIAAGLLPEEKAMGMRMMLGMFTVAGDGEDSLNSKIEFRPGGEILANGQRIK